MRHRHGSSSAGLKIGRFLFSQLIKSSHKSRWRVGNDIKRCTLCGRCEMVCFYDAIAVSRHNKTWTLNNMRCNQCLKCIVSCPTQCLKQVPL